MCQPINAATPSGSSCLATEGTVTANYCSTCFPGAGTCSDLVSCASQMQQAATAITSVLKALAPSAGQLNLGLASFPATGDQCGAGSIQIPIGDAVTTIPTIAAFYGNAKPSGGGPMAATLAVAATDPTLANPDPSVRKVILLVTNGWPNCASSSPCTAEPWSDGKDYGCASPAEVAATGSTATPPPGCTCSFGTCASASAPASCCPVSSTVNSALYCLDDEATANELASLFASQNITTFVVALGLGYGGNGAVLTELAGAGHGSATPFSAGDPAAIETLLASLIN